MEIKLRKGVTIIFQEVKEFIIIISGSISTSSISSISSSSSSNSSILVAMPI